MLQYLKVYDDLFKAVKGCMWRVFVVKTGSVYTCKISDDELSENGDYIIRSNIMSSTETVLIGSFTTQESAEMFKSKVERLPKSLSKIYESSVKPIVEFDSCNCYKSVNELMNSDIYHVKLDTTSNKFIILTSTLLFNTDINMYVNIVPNNVIRSSNSLSGCKMNVEFPSKEVISNE